MISNKKINYFKKFVVFFITFTMLIGLIITQDALALNSYISQGKPTAFVGYKIIDNNTIQVFVDKPSTADINQFKIFEGNSTEIKIKSMTSLFGSRTEFSDTGIYTRALPNGGCFELTIGDSDDTSVTFQPGELYTVVMNNNISGTYPLGWYTSHKDITFSFTAPDTFADPNGNGTYSSSAPAVINTWPEDGATNVAVENGIWITTSIPVDDHNDSNGINNLIKFREGLILTKNNGQSVSYDDYFYTYVDTKTNTSAEIYKPIVNNDHNCFIFLQTAGGPNGPCYNLDPDTQYTLSIPEITLVNGNIIPARTISFHTAGSTVSNPFIQQDSPPISVTNNGEDLKVDWTNYAPLSTPIEAPVGTLPVSQYVSPPPSGYNVYASTDKDWNFTKLNSSPITDTSFITSNCGLKPDTSYYFRLTTVSNTNIFDNTHLDTIESGFSRIFVQATTPSDTTVPFWSGESTINVLNVTTNSIDLNWTAAQDSYGIQSYKIYKNGTLIDTVNGGTTSYNVTDLEENTQYTFKIEAGDSSNNWSTNGPSTSVKTLDATAPYWSEQSTVSASSITGESLTLSWTEAQDSAGITSYRICKDGSLIGTVNGDSTSYCVTGLEQNTEYTFKIEAGDASNNWSIYGPSCTVKTKDVTAPYWSEGSKLNVSNITKNSLTLDWPAAQDNEGVTNYRIYKNDLLIETLDSKRTSFDIIGLNVNTEYTFKIEAGDGTNNWNTIGLAITAKTLDNYIPNIISVSLQSLHNSLELGSLPVTEQVTAKVYDQHNIEITNQNINWSIIGSPIGVSINKNGLITVQPFASIGTITVKGIISGTNITDTKKFDIKPEVLETAINHEATISAITDAASSDAISLPDSATDIIAIEGQSLQDINTADKPMILNNSNIRFQLRPTDMNLGGSLLSNIQQLQMGMFSVDSETKAKLITDDTKSGLSEGSYSLAAMPFKLSAVALLNNGTGQQITSFNNPIKISVTAPVGFELAKNQTLIICRFNTETGKWEEKGQATFDKDYITFNTSSFSYWTIMIKTKSDDASLSTDSETVNSTDNDTVNSTDNDIVNSTDNDIVNSTNSEDDNEAITIAESDSDNNIEQTEAADNNSNDVVNDITTVKETETANKKPNIKIWFILGIALLIICRMGIVIFKKIKSKEIKN